MWVFLQVMGWILHHCSELCSQLVGVEADSVCLARSHSQGAGALPAALSCQLLRSQPAGTGGMAQHRKLIYKCLNFSCPSEESRTSQDISGFFLNWWLRRPLQIQRKLFKYSILNWAATRLTSDFQEVKLVPSNSGYFMILRDMFI